MARGGNDHDRNRLIRALAYFVVAFLATPALGVVFRVEVGISFLMGGALGICLVVTTFVLASIGL
ncbi:hypothetical protein [Halorubellus salinus]|uniref:hypothetical protein n=1 Tax=Halorubellus salinus TaxID=755309 RepID=UPI001D068EBE|nr:hypothetical protein [Halorubellus salinus]